MLPVPKEFALAVVSSSDPNLTIEEKFDLYGAAYNFAEKKQAELKKGQPKQDVQKTIKHIKDLGL